MDAHASWQVIHENAPEALRGRIFLEPAHGQENGVIALYSMFSSHVPRNSDYRHLWPQLLACSGAEGVDALGMQFDDFWNPEQFNIGDSPIGLMKGVEFKAYLDPDDKDL